MSQELDAILENVKKVNEANDALIGMSRAATEEQQKTGQETIDLLKTLGDASEAVTRSRLAGEMAANANNREAATAFGVNMDSANQVVTMLGARAIEQLGRVVALQDSIAAKNQMRITEDPLGFLYAAATINQDAAELDKAAKQFDVTLSMFAKLNAATQTQTQTNNAIATKITAESAQAAAALAKAEWELKVKELEHRNLGIGITSYTALMNANQQQLQNSITAYQLMSTEENRAFQREQAAMLRDQRKAELERKLKDEKAEQDIVDTVNKGRAILGLNTLEAGKIMQLMRMPGSFGEALRNQYNVGANFQATGKAFFGATPGEAAVLIASSSAPLDPHKKKVYDFIVNSLNQVRQANPDLSKDPKAVNDELNKFLFGKKDKDKKVKGEVEKSSDMIKPGDNSNIYQAPPFSDVSSQADVKSTPFFKIVLEPLKVAGTVELTPDDMLSKGVAAIVNKQLRPEDVVDGIVRYFNAAVVMNNQMKNYEAFNIPVQASFKTPIQGIGVLGSAVPINLLDRAQVMNALLTRLTTAQLRERGVSFTPGAQLP